MNDEEYKRTVSMLINGACDAEEYFTLDELEEYTNKMRGEKNESN